MAASHHGTSSFNATAAEGFRSLTALAYWAGVTMTRPPEEVTACAAVVLPPCTNTDGSRCINNTGAVASSPAYSANDEDPFRATPSAWFNLCSKAPAHRVSNKAAARPKH